MSSLDIFFPATFSFHLHYPCIVQDATRTRFSQKSQYGMYLLISPLFLRLSISKKKDQNGMSTVYNIVVIALPSFLHLFHFQVTNMKFSSRIVGQQYEMAIVYGSPIMGEFLINKKTCLYF